MDIFLAATKHQLKTIERAVLLDIAGSQVPVVSLEDLILQKLAAGRGIDIYDAEELVKEQGASLDWGYLNKWGASLGLDRQIAGLSSLRTDGP